MLIAVLGLVRSGIVGRGRLSAVGNRLAVLEMALILRKLLTELETRSLQAFYDGEDRPAK